MLDGPTLRLCRFFGPVNRHQQSVPHTKVCGKDIILLELLFIGIGLQGDLVPYQLLIFF